MNDIKKETDAVQNIISRLMGQIVLNVDKPSVKIKKQYRKVQAAFIDLHYELDVLNDLKDEAEGR